MPAMNTPTGIIVPGGRTLNTTTNESVARQKRGRPIDFKDSAPRKRRVNNHALIKLQKKMFITL